MRRIVIGLAFSALLSTPRGIVAASDAAPDCEAFIDRRIPYLVRQRAALELAGYVRTGDPEHFDRGAEFTWFTDPKDRGASVVKDPNRNGRAFFHPGYRQATYFVRLEATSGGKRCAPSPPVVINVDVDYTQYLQVASGTLNATGAQSGANPFVAGRIVDEFTQILLPMYVSLEGRRTSTSSRSTHGQSDVEMRAGVKLFDPRIYVGMSYGMRTSAGSAVTSGMGYGIEKIPDVDRTWSGGVFAWYYPAFGKGRGYRMLEYGASITRVLPSDRYFIEIGARRDHGVAYGAGLRSFDDVTPFAAIGLRL